MSSTLSFDVLKDYLAANLNCSAEQIQVDQLPGGYSNLSFLVHSPTEKFILRRPPFGEKIAKAHDMGREFKILQGLKRQDIPRVQIPFFFVKKSLFLELLFF